MVKNTDVEGSKATEGRDTKDQDGYDLKFVLAIVALVAVIFVSSVQTVQLANLQTEVENNLEELAEQGPRTASIETSDLEQNVEELPGMVGGC